MLNELRSPRDAGCLSDFVFDAWYAGELEPERERAAAEHLASCKHCSARHNQLDLERARFLAQAPEFLPPGEKRARATPKAGQRRSAWLGGALALAAVLALAVVKIGKTPEFPEGPGTRLKGSEKLTFFVKRGAQVFEGLPGQSVAPGDQLRFAVTSAAPTHVAVLSLDAAGTASVYHPTAGSAASAVGAANQHALSSAVELDGVLGKELIFGVFCSAPFEVEPLRKKLEAERALSAPNGCALDRLELVKEKLP